MGTELLPYWSFISGFSTVAHKVESRYCLRGLIGDSGSGVGRSCTANFPVGAMVFSENFTGLTYVRWRANSMVSSLSSLPRCKFPTTCHQKEGGNSVGTNHNNTGQDTYLIFSQLLDKVLPLSKL